MARSAACTLKAQAAKSKPAANCLNFLKGSSTISSDPDFLQCRRNPALVVAERHPEAIGLQVVGSVAHNIRNPGKLKHFQVVVVIADGHDLVPAIPSMLRPASESVALRALSVQHVHNAQV